MRKNQLTKLPKLSIDMRNKNLSVNDYYKQITGAKKVQDVSWWTYNLAFWRIGQLLSNAELNLKEGYTDLCKRLSNDDIIRVRDQQRFKKLARSRRIQKIIMKAPPKHTVLSWLDSLTEKNFKKIRRAKIIKALHFHSSREPDIFVIGEDFSARSAKIFAILYLCTAFFYSQMDRESYK